MLTAETDHFRSKPILFIGLEGLGKRTLNELNHSPLRFRIKLDVSLSPPQVRMASKPLTIANRFAERRNLPRRIGDERPLSAVA
jgi:hypothetical protein